MNNQRQAANRGAAAVADNDDLEGAAAAALAGAGGAGRFDVRQLMTALREFLANGDNQNANRHDEEGGNPTDEPEDIEEFD